MSRQAKAVDQLEMSAPVRVALQSVRAEAGRTRVQLREANAELTRLRAELDEVKAIVPEFPEYTTLTVTEQAYVRRLRREAGGFRVKLRETEARLAEAQATIARLRLDNSDLLAGIIPQGA